MHNTHFKIFYNLSQNCVKPHIYRTSSIYSYFHKFRTWRSRRGGGHFFTSSLLHFFTSSSSLSSLKVIHIDFQLQIVECSCREVYCCRFDISFRTEIDRYRTVRDRGLSGCGYDCTVCEFEEWEDG